MTKISWIRLIIGGKSNFLQPTQSSNQYAIRGQSVLSGWAHYAQLPVRKCWAESRLLTCNTCHGMLSEQAGQYWKGTSDLLYNHHSHGKELEQSAQANCTIFTALFEALQLILQNRAAKMMATKSGIPNPMSMAVINFVRIEYVTRLMSSRPPAQSWTLHKHCRDGAESTGIFVCYADRS